jgi:hypothetical protein
MNPVSIQPPNVTMTDATLGCDSNHKLSVSGVLTPKETPLAEEFPNWARSNFRFFAD